MSIEVNGKSIATDEEGYLLDPNDWNEDVAAELVRQHEAAGHKPVNETGWGLINYFREYYEDKQTHPSMNELVRNLGKQPGQSFREAEEYKNFLYQLFPHGPVRMLCKLAGLPRPKDEIET